MPIPAEAGPPHVPVMVEQVLELLDPQPGAVCLDCTVGQAGHALQIAPRLAPGGHYIGLDLDAGNADASREHLRAAGGDVRVSIAHAGFASAGAILHRLGLRGADLLLADLGFASNQMADAGRGLSFRVDGPLDMRLDRTRGPTAADLVNDLPEEELADLIYRHGEERHSRRIARKIVDARTRSPILTTIDLADLVRQVYGRAAGGRQGVGRWRIDPATRTFMALRIAVNGELDSLRRLLDGLTSLLNIGGVAVVISFHSLEDRLVKRAFQALREAGLVEVLTRKPLVASQPQRRANPRCRSAKLRAVRRTGATDVPSPRPAGRAASTEDLSQTPHTDGRDHDTRNQSRPADRNGRHPADRHHRDRPPGGRTGDGHGTADGGTAGPGPATT